ncbi:right-handed parallel beta-helix repeat-containing protein [Streptomyces chartreusis]|uniref:right-handed parallel beta-helix repeat-containing protein n=1 Tax=Streptomyces chartreusis TaxID=1969 RepID=UPI00381978EB
MSRRTARAALTALALGAGPAVLPTQAQAATVVVSNSTDLSNAIKNASAGTVIQIRGGTYYPPATLQSTANGTSSSPITLTPDSAVVCQSCTGTNWNNIKTINGGDSGFTLTGDGTVDNTVRNIDSYGHYDAANHGENADGIAVKYGSGTGNLITGARLYNNSDDGLDFWSFSSPVTVEHTWAFGNGKNRWSDSAFAGDGNGYKLGGDGEVVAHVVNNSAAWDNAGNGFTENSNTGAIVINRTTAYANAKWGHYFATGASRLGKNLAVSNGSGPVSKGGSVVSAGNNWDSGISTPAFRSTDASTAYNARQSNGSLPTTTFLTTGSTTVGATMD